MAQSLCHSTLILPTMSPAKSTESSLVPRQELNCLRVAAPFYREACKAGDMNYFLNDFFVSYFKQFPIPQDLFPAGKAKDDETWRREQVSWS
jgi:hypothetical protein